MGRLLSNNRAGCGRVKGAVPEWLSEKVREPAAQSKGERSLAWRCGLAGVPVVLMSFGLFLIGFRNNQQRLLFLPGVSGNSLGACEDAFIRKTGSTLTVACGERILDLAATGRDRRERFLRAEGAGRRTCLRGSFMQAIRARFLHRITTLILAVGTGGIWILSG